MNICIVCFKGYKPTRYPQFYCSRECYYKSTVGHKSYTAKATIEKICLFCNKTFLTGGRLGKKEKKYCSLECLYKSNYKNDIEPKTLSETERAYLAGIMDGEGNISLLKSRGRNPRVRIQVTNTDVSLIDWIVGITGVGNINTKPGTDKHKKCYTWVCNNEPAINVLKQIKDYLILKSDRCRLALEASSLLESSQYKNGQELYNIIDELYNKMKELNKRGPK